MIESTCKRDKKQLLISLSLCKQIDTNRIEWSIKTYNHITMVTNAAQPTIIYLALKDSRMFWRLLGLEISKVGQIYCLPDQKEFNDFHQSLIPVIISGFEQDSMTQL